MRSVSPPVRVTVVVATYNRSKLLPFAIASVLGQSFTDWELLVVGDGCTDDSQAVVEAVADPRVRWIGLPVNSGHQSAPNNEGLRQARGDYVAYLGHDDLWFPHHLASLVAALETGADVAYGLVRYVDRSGAWEPVFAHRAYAAGAWLPPTSVMHRTALAARACGWQDYRTLHRDPDTALWERMHDAGARFALVPRLTAVKFPGSARRDVYRDRPTTEQAEWLARIQSDPDLEARELSAALCATSPPARQRYADLARVFAGETLRRARRRLASIGAPRVAGPGAELEQTRLFRGLAPALDRRPSIAQLGETGS